MPSTFIKTFDTPTFKGTISVPLGLYINGEFVDPVEGGTLE
jgi:aldehyde dehydrogenase (NAD+)